MFKNKYELKVYCIFFDRWLTLKEASRIYNPNMPETAWNDKTLYTHLKALKKKGWIDDKEDEDHYYKNRKSTYPTTVYKSNYNFILNRHISNHLKDFFILFLDSSSVKSHLKWNYKDNIPLGIEDVLKQLLSISIAFKQLNYAFNLKETKGFFDISKVTIKNYQNIIKHKRNKYSKNKLPMINKEFNDNLLNKLDRRKIFWTFLNLHALVMMKLFFNKGLSTNLIRASPRLHLWIYQNHKDFDFIY